MTHVKPEFRLKSYRQNATNLTVSEYARTRPDGVHVVPLACLKD